jgi:succinyl-diaminopimelate desuccinylase
LDKHGTPSEVIAPQELMPNVVSSFDGEVGEGPCIVYNGHIDTFPASDLDGWKHGLYSGHFDGKGVLRLGSVDMKAGTAASIIAYTLLHAQKHLLRGSLALTAVSDEETGGKWGSRYLL